MLTTTTSGIGSPARRHRARTARTMASARRTIATRRSPRVRANDSPARQSRRLNQPYRLTTNGTGRSPSCNQPCAVRVSTVQPFSTKPVGELGEAVREVPERPVGAILHHEDAPFRRLPPARAVIPHPYSHTMGYRGKLAAQEQARRLRAQNMTLADIAAALGVSKSSVSVWVRDVPFTPSPRRYGPQRRTAPRPHRQAPPDRGARRARHPTHRHARRARLPRRRRRALRGRRRQGRRCGQVREHRPAHDRASSARGSGASS